MSDYEWIDEAPYPEVSDGGEISHEGLPDGNGPAEKFAEWFKAIMNYDRRF